MNNKLLASSIERPLLAQWVPDSGAKWVPVQTGCQILVQTGCRVPVLVQTGCQFLVQTGCQFLVQTGCQILEHWELGAGRDKYEKYENGIWELGSGPCINAPVIFVLRSQVIELITLINH